MKRSTARWMSIPACLAVLGLAACGGGQQPPYFSGAQTEDDRLPSIVEWDEVLGDSTRLLGTDSDGNRYFAAKAGEGSDEMYCLVIVTTGEQWASGCSPSLPVTVGIDPAVKATLYAAASSDGAGEWVGDYVRVGD